MHPLRPDQSLGYHRWYSDDYGTGVPVNTSTECCHGGSIESSITLLNRLPDAFTDENWTGKGSGEIDVDLPIQSIDSGYDVCPVEGGPHKNGEDLCSDADWQYLESNSSAVQDILDVIVTQGSMVMKNQGDPSDVTYSACDGALAGATVQLADQVGKGGDFYGSMSWSPNNIEVGLGGSGYVQDFDTAVCLQTSTAPYDTSLCSDNTGTVGEGCLVSEDSTEQDLEGAPPSTVALNWYQPLLRNCNTPDPVEYTCNPDSSDDRNWHPIPQGSSTAGIANRCIS